MTGVSFRERLADVRDRIERAAARSGRRGAAITLVAVSKTHPVERILEAAEAGIAVFGENYVQEAEEKVAALPGATWHLIGRLQANKAGKAAGLFSWIQTADSERILRALDRHAAERGRTLSVLLEVNLGGESQKAGAPPADVPALLSAASELTAVRVRGLMAIPPPFEDPEKVRPYFAALRELRDRLASPHGAGKGLTELSMGMSGDFEVAIEEGATMVRVGTALFGPREGGRR